MGIPHAALYPVGGFEGPWTGLVQGVNSYNQPSPAIALFSDVDETEAFRRQHGGDGWRTGNFGKRQLMELLQQQHEQGVVFTVIDPDGTSSGQDKTEHILTIVQRIEDALE